MYLSIEIILMNNMYACRIINYLMFRQKTLYISALSVSCTALTTVRIRLLYLQNSAKKNQLHSIVVRAILTVLTTENFCQCKCTRTRAQLMRELPTLHTRIVIIVI